MKVTIKDVAKEANVAPSTVSRVLSDNARISDETKQKVQAAIKKLNYKPNQVARSLAKSKTRVIGVVLPHEAQDLFSNPFFIQAMQGISTYAQKHNYYITYAFSEDEKSERKHIKNFTRGGMIDGLVLLKAKTNDESMQYLQKEDFPFVVIGRPEDPTDILWVDNDNFKAMYNLVGELVRKGKKNILMIGARKEWNVSKDRLVGYMISLETNGIKVNEDLIVYKRKFSEENGYNVTKEMLESKKDIDAIVATDDLLAFGSLKYLKEEGRKDISVIGFNNTPLAGYQKPPLSSVDINAEQLGYYAAKLLIDKLENKEMVNTHYIIDSKLIERESMR